MADQPGMPHARHDRELIAGLAAGELTSADRTRAMDVLSSCAECARLASDLRALADATRKLPSVFEGSVAPAPRDFRITARDAARIGRPPVPGFARWRAQSVWPRRLGGALATLGLVGLLVSAAPIGFSGPAGGESALGLRDPGVGAATLDPRQPAAVSPDVTVPDLTVKSSTLPGRDTNASEPKESIAPIQSGALMSIAVVMLLAGLALILATRGGRRVGL